MKADKIKKEVAELWFFGLAALGLAELTLFSHLPHAKIIGFVALLITMYLTPTLIKLADKLDD